MRAVVIKHPLDLCPQHRGLAQLASGGDRGQFVIGQRGPEEVRQPRSEGMVIERTRAFVEVEETRRRKDRLVRAAQRRVEFVAVVQTLLEKAHGGGERRVVDRLAQRPGQKFPEQPLAVGLRVGRDGNQRIAPPVLIAAVLWNLRQRLAGTFRFHDARGFERQIAEQSLVARRRKIAERAFEFHQFECEPRAGERPVERLAFESVLQFALVGQLPAVDLDEVALVQHHFEFEHSGGISRRVERRQRPPPALIEGRPCGLGVSAGVPNANFQRQRMTAGVDRLRDNFQPIAALRGSVDRLEAVCVGHDVHDQSLAIEPHGFVLVTFERGLFEPLPAGAAKRQLLFRRPRGNRGIERQISGLLIPHQMGG